MNVQRASGTVTQLGPPGGEVHPEGEEIWRVLHEIDDGYMNARGRSDALMEAIRRRFRDAGTRRDSSEINWEDICRYIERRYIEYFINDMLLPMPTRDAAANERVFGEQAMLIERAKALFLLFEGQPWGQRGLAMLHDVSNLMLSAAAGILFLSGDESEPSMGHRDSFSRESFDLSTVSSLFNVICRLNKARAKEGDVYMKTNGDEIDLAEGVRFDIFRVVNELVINATKYADPEKDERIVYLKSTPRKNKLQISVEDNGIGMESIERAVLRGVRLHPEIEDGDGLGLNNVSEITAGRSWDFDIFSVPGVGSTITIGMPMHIVGARLIAGI